MEKKSKFIIIGFNASGKMATINTLENMGVNVGKIFRTIDTIPDKYSLSTVVYDPVEVNNIFENHAYLFIKESTNKANKFYEYQNHDVFVMTPDQFNMVAKFDDNVVFVWLDNTTIYRRNRHRMEKRKYDFISQECIEQEFIQDFTDRIYKNNVLYFNNEDPDRVASIIYSLIKHPDLLDVYIKNFN